MTTSAPKLIGDRGTVTKQAGVFVNTMAKLATLAPSEAADMLQLCSHTQAWVVIYDANGGVQVVPAKFGGYAATVTQYSQYRDKTMDGGAAAKKIEQWAVPAKPGDPAFAAVHDFCNRHGAKTRATVRVLVANAPSAGATPTIEANKDQAIADLILAVLPHLNAAQRARVAAGARTL
jgi:hypothetical protein